MGYIYTKSGKLAKRLYFGAVLLFEGLYYTFKNRVLADGGTFVENELPTISQDAKLVLTPNAYKAGKLYSAVPNDGTGDFTVDRNSTATYIDKDGLIKTALANVPRIDWSTGEAVLLVEPQSTNLITYSEDFSDSYWNSTVALTITANQAISPDGTLNADKIEKQDSNVWRGVLRDQITLNIGDDYTISVFVKKGTGVSAGVKVQSASLDLDAKINFTTGEIVSREQTGAWNTNGFVELSNGWYYVFATYTALEESNIVGINPDGGTTVGAYNYAWGAQIEQGSSPTSYISTNGTTVTRLADEISVLTPAGVTSITETIDGVEQTPITTIPATYSLPVGNINKVTML